MSELRKQRFRQRKKRSSFLDLDEEKKHEEETTEPTKIPVIKSNNKDIRDTTEIPKKDRVSQSKLSFVGDEDDDEGDNTSSFKVRKSKYSLKHQKKKRQTLKSLVNPDAPVAGKNDRQTNYYAETANDYSAERLAEMKKDFTIRMKKTHVFEQPREQDNMVISDDFSAILVPKPREEKLPVQKNNPEMVIPSQERIAEIKAQRARRQRCGYDEFIPRNEQNFISLTNNSVEEEENSSSEDEHLRIQGYEGRTIKFGDPGREKRGPTLQDMEVEGESDDEESRKWEKDQLAKSGIKNSNVYKNLANSELDVDMDIEDDIEPHFPKTAMDPFSYQPPSLEMLTKKNKIFAFKYEISAHRKSNANEQNYVGH